MSTTTIRLSDELKARVARAAERAGTTTHGFIVDAIAEKTAEQERRDEFHALAERRFAEFLKSGKGIPWNEAREYLLKRLEGEPAKRPTARKLKL